MTRTCTKYDSQILKDQHYDSILQMPRVWQNMKYEKYLNTLLSNKYRTSNCIPDLSTSKPVNLLKSLQVGKYDILTLLISSSIWYCDAWFAISTRYW